MKINSGVSQGSVLGPLLWNILYDGVLGIPTPVNVTLIGFADNLAVVATAKDKDTLQRKLNATLDRIANCMRDNYLSITPEEATIFSGRKIVGSVSLQVWRQNISIKNEVKYLGVGNTK